MRVRPPPIVRGPRRVCVLIVPWPPNTGRDDWFHNTVEQPARDGREQENAAWRVRYSGFGNPRIAGRRGRLAARHFCNAPPSLSSKLPHATAADQFDDSEKHERARERNEHDWMLKPPLVIGAPPMSGVMTKPASKAPTIPTTTLKISPRCPSVRMTHYAGRVASYAANPAGAGLTDGIGGPAEHLHEDEIRLLGQKTHFGPPRAPADGGAGERTIRRGAIADTSRTSLRTRGVANAGMHNERSFG
jgi:hypothetical protein